MVNHSVQSSTFIMIELYVKLKARWNTPNEDFASDSRGHETPNAYIGPISSTMLDASFGTNRNQSVLEKKIEDLEFNIGLDDINPEERVEKLVSQDTTLIGNTCDNDDFMTMDFTSFEDLNYNSEEELYETMTSWPLRDRSDSHLVASWNNIDVIVDIIGECNYFDDEGYATEDGLAVGHCFRSKDHLKWVVHDFHIKANHTFKKRKSNKSMYTIECTDQNCHWRLYASRRQSDNAFIINTRQGPHECVMSRDRLEYPHSTSSFMSSLIRKSVKDNVRFTIKDMKIVIEQRYSFKTPYLKCWRAKKIAIAQLFGG
jgi:MuDR family transposase